MLELTDNERNYLAGQLLGRLATIGPDGSPQVRPVGFIVNEQTATIDIGGHNLGRSRKFANIRRDNRVSLVVDDLASIEPWAPRGIEIRGEAEAIGGVEPVRPGFSSELILIHPIRVIAWGLDTGAFDAPNARNTHPKESA